MEDLYDGHRRRVNDHVEQKADSSHAILYNIVAQHNESLIRMEASITGMVNAIKDQEKTAAEHRQRMFDCVPNGDHDGHRRYHEAVIQRMEARAALWQDVQKSVAKWGVIALLGWMAVAMWHEVIVIGRVALAATLSK